jgi:hypothetical protein
MLSTIQRDEDAVFSFSKCQSRCLLSQPPLKFVPLQGQVKEQVKGEEADRLCKSLAQNVI